VDSLRDKGFTDESMTVFFNHSKNSGLHDSLLKNISKNRGKSTSSKVSPQELIDSAVIGLDPITNEGINKWNNRPMFYHMGVAFAKYPAGRSQNLISKMRSVSGLWIRNFYTDVIRNDLGLKFQSISDPYGDSDSNATVGDMLPDEPQDIDYSLVWEVPEIRESIRSEVIKDISYRISPSDPESAKRYKLEVAILNAIVENPGLIEVSKTLDQYGDLQFGIQQGQLTSAVIRTTGQEMSPQYVGRICKNFVLPDIDAQLTLESSKTRKIIDKKFGLAQSYRQDIRRRASVRRLVARFIARNNG
jgi:hypothetical protein